MPRVNPGLDYFPLDVDIDTDDKIELIEAKHGIIGFAVIIRLFMKIYRNSYYYDWGEKEQLLFSKRLNVDINALNAIVNDALEWEIFNKEIFDRWQILTSKGIQKRFLDAAKRRQKVEIISEYLILGDNCLNEYNNILIVNILTDNVDIKKQSRVEKSRVKKSNKDHSPDSTEPDPADGLFDIDSPPFKAAVYLANKIQGNNPRATVPRASPDDSKMQKWALELDRLNRIGPPGGDVGYSWQEIRLIIDWSQQDSFWQSNILSAAKLREKVVVLENQMQRDSPRMSKNAANALKLVEKYEREGE